MAPSREPCVAPSHVTPPAIIRSVAAFSDKFIAYVDVLGFKGLVSDSERGAGLPLSELLKLLECLGTGSERAKFAEYGPTCCPGSLRRDKHLDFRALQISDCVIVTTEISPAGVINLVSHCWGAVITLLTHGIMCRGYIKRGSVYHTDRQVIGSGYQDAYEAEGSVSAFKREADDRGTPYVEVDSAVTAYIADQGDKCVSEMFSRMIKRDGDAVVLFPFKRLTHEFMITSAFDASKEREVNQNLRVLIGNIKARVWSFVNQSDPRAVAKAKHYIAALDEQLAVCDNTDEVIETLLGPFPAPCNP